MTATPNAPLMKALDALAQHPVGQSTYTVYWLDGTREVIHGENIHVALLAAGYGEMSVRAMDMYRIGDNTEYRWNAKKRYWERDVLLGG